MMIYFLFLLFSLWFGSLYACNEQNGFEILKRDAYNVMSGGTLQEGVNHNPIVAPNGSTYYNIRIGKNGEEVGAFWTSKAKSHEAKQAFLMMHGKMRDGGNYWTIMNNILQNAISKNIQGVDPHSIIIAPQFFSERDNSGQFNNQTLAWSDVNAWQAGEIAIFPKGTQLSSFDALDSLIKPFLDPTLYPNMERFTVVGHGGGGQLIQRYATVGQVDSTNRVHVRFIHGDPSSCDYFTPDRIISMENQTIPTKESCPTYNTWRYGFDNFTSSNGQTKTPQEYFSNYISRDVVSLVGYQDIQENGDDYCMAKLQGGEQRRDRNLVWWKYINTLARTLEDLSGFPGTFDTLPDWSNLKPKNGNSFGVHLIVIEDADHDAEKVFESSEGQAALFTVDSTNLPTGWRPQGWIKAPNPNNNNAVNSQSQQQMKSSNAIKSQKNTLLLTIIASLPTLICSLNLF